MAANLAILFFYLMESKTAFENKLKVWGTGAKFHMKRAFYHKSMKFGGLAPKHISIDFRTGSISAGFRNVHTIHVHRAQKKFFGGRKILQNYHFCRAIVTTKH